MVFSFSMRPKAGAADKGLLRLTYESTLACSDEREGEVLLAEIMASALKNNTPLGITGMLYFDRKGRSIVQVLEGPEAAVRGLFEVILKDPRHTGCEVLKEQKVTARVHEDFGMALARTTSESHAALRSAARSKDHLVSGLPISYSRGKRGGGTEGMHLIRLQYSSTLVTQSTSLASGTPAHVQQARGVISNILRSSVRNNSELKVGGLLCFNPTTLGVVQVLEGPPFAVKSLYARIAEDPRHTGVTLTSEEVLFSKYECLFDAGWGMLQSDTSAVSLLDLSYRLKRAYDAQTRGGESHLAAAALPSRRQMIIEEATGGGTVVVHVGDESDGASDAKDGLGGGASKGWGLNLW